MRNGNISDYLKQNPAADRLRLVNIRLKESLPEAMLIHLISQCCEIAQGLEYLHSLGVVHCNLSVVSIPVLASGSFSDRFEIRLAYLFPKKGRLSSVASFLRNVHNPRARKSTVTVYHLTGPVSIRSSTPAGIGTQANLLTFAPSVCSSRKSVVCGPICFHGHKLFVAAFRPSSALVWAIPRFTWG